MTADAPVTSYSDRSCSARETMSRIAPSLSKYGVTRLSRLTDLDRVGIPVWNAISPNSRSIVINQGKGIEDIDAKVSAAMEALERAVAGAPTIGVRQASFRELESEGFAADPLPSLILGGQSEIRPEEILAWTLGYDIISQHDVWVPRDALLLDDTGANQFWQSSDGLASGNTLLEATFHGLLERIERDADVLSQFDSEEEVKRRCIAVDSLADPVLTELAKRVHDAGFRLQMFDMTSDVGIPCFKAYMAPMMPSEGALRYIEVTYGAGAHPNPVRAAIRAVTESAQSRLTYISGARDDIDPDTFTRPLPDHLRDMLSIQPRSYVPLPCLAGETTLDGMLKAVIGKLEDRGIKSVITVHLNPGEDEFSVVKVLVPELENVDGRRKRRFGPRALKRILKSR
ncbi:putative methanogenesis marker protein 1 [Agrobacterium sp. DSM 25558]|uniref:YcaO-like family protein n=1 Tax=Agrobacterium sp. DSM 25558 TaxID=1907665 RepID=UPI0009724532|nr:YcaO-like family protein [Agrobacterium sp. DSM 25558]SCX32562.1 putative methanogenesis marker protein 1 [Agrobacterium sp. DSM 25558]